MQQHVNVIRHDNISTETASVLIKLGAPQMQIIVDICLFKEREPFETGECDELEGVLCGMSTMGSHEMKLIIFGLVFHFRLSRVCSSEFFFVRQRPFLFLRVLFE
jgi:hypothetical protein